MDVWGWPALLGLGLAAATGLRTFLPLLMLSAAAHFELLGTVLNESFAWVGSTGALVALSIATVVELAADKIPVVDNFLSTAGTVTKPIAAMVAAGSVFSSVDPSTAAIAGLVVGAPTALAFGGAQAGTRAVSTATTAGLGNPIVSTIEDIASFLLTLIAFLAPILVPIIVGIGGWFAWKGVRRVRAARRGTPATPAPTSGDPPSAAA